MAKKNQYINEYLIKLKFSDIIDIYDRVTELGDYDEHSLNDEESEVKIIQGRDSTRVIIRAVHESISHDEFTL